MGSPPTAEGAAQRRFNALIAPLKPDVERWACQLCRSHVDPDDVVQESLMRAFKAIDQINDPERARS